MERQNTAISENTSDVESTLYETELDDRAVGIGVETIDRPERHVIFKHVAVIYVGFMIAVIGIYFFFGSHHHHG